MSVQHRRAMRLASLRRMVVEMDTLLAARRLPALSARACCAAILSALDCGYVAPRTIVDGALVRFERLVVAAAFTSVRPALLFAERDRIVADLRRFIGSRAAVRLMALRRQDVLAIGRGARPFDALVRDRAGRVYGVVIRRLPEGGGRLDFLLRIATLSRQYKDAALGGVLVYDLRSGCARLVRDSRVLRIAA